jgi:hypothetical protein
LRIIRILGKPSDHAISLKLNTPLPVFIQPPLVNSTVYVHDLHFLRKLEFLLSPEHEMNQKTDTHQNTQTNHRHDDHNIVVTLTGFVVGQLVEEATLHTPLIVRTLGTTFNTFDTA